ncbi:MAG TPA: TonB family protein [Acidobacteriaceae bacterium]|nr:TonB family protein [Acidobacteriaceae bacterium]
MPRDIIELQREPFGKSFGGSIVLHVGIVAALSLMVWVNGRIRGNQWGNNAPPGAVQATLVSSAPSVPLPNVTPPTPNVLATQEPSPSPAPPSKETIPLQDLNAIPIPTHEMKRREAEKPHPAAPKYSQPTSQPNSASYGEAGASNLARTMNSTTAHNNSPVNVAGGDFAARFPWYVEKIQRMVSQNWYTQQIDTGTRVGSQANVTFTIGRDGRPYNIHLTAPSPSGTLNTTAVQAVQRVETFGPLPDQYTGNNVSVEYTFTYDQPK